MARLSQKILKNLIDLDFEFTSREEFTSLICSPLNISKWKKFPCGFDINGIPLYIANPVNNDEWMNLLFKKHSWQLTTWGAISLSHTYIYYNVQHQSSSDITITGKILLGMNRIINGPWHIHHNNIRIWNQNSHFELQMFDGDVNRFIDFNKAV